MTMDETLYSVAEKVQNFAVIYLVDITEVPDFNKVCVLNLSRSSHAECWHRCTSCMTHALSCSSIGTLFVLCARCVVHTSRQQQAHHDRSWNG